MKLSLKDGKCLKVEPETPGEGVTLGMLIGTLQAADVPVLLGPDDEYICIPIQFDEPHDAAKETT